MLHSTRIDIPAATRIQVIDLLNVTLAYTLDLKTQVKQAHWNVKGLDFYQLHQLFDELAGELEEYIDLVAERITTLGGTAMGTVRTAAAVSQLPEYPFDILDGKDHITALADRYAQFAKLLRDGIHITDDWGDADTADLYTEVSRAVDMRLWFLEAHLQTGETAMATNGSTKTGTVATAKSAAKTAAKASATTKATAEKSPEKSPKATAKKAKTKSK